MTRFEVGKKYYEGGVTYEILKKTAKTITYKATDHTGRFNERVLEQKTVKLREWGYQEVFYVHNRYTVEAENVA